ncbi:hypothetical protein SJAG_04345 [Schizosaccharomyces japonicus yFS275]|uniref:Ubiquitin-protein ligase Sel1/Ubx2 n=1 Tax=Schizosaccharomyces japonicus (strain yFS275 / FY16936) TaxID=402676 RepID=B6K6L0_SCHJY|nr:hypothetical protein SJAG_04345 [Schizosaccharomyces japonicus yFS275]EEB09164.1 hypothetical protein SJAG_04345 [Schizosaccharomyces japonicus yFS275]
MFHTLHSLRTVLITFFLCISISAAVSIPDAGEHDTLTDGRFSQFDLEYEDPVEKALGMLRKVPELVSENQMQQTIDYLDFYTMDEMNLGSILAERAINILKVEAQKNNTDAVLWLGNIFFFGLFNLVAQFEEAFEFYSQLAQLNGSAIAHVVLSSYYAAGYTDLTSRDPSLVFLHAEAAARQGSLDAKQLLAYHSLEGIHTSKNYERAASLYKNITDSLFNEKTMSPMHVPGGLMLPMPDFNSAGAEHYGIYGYASAYQHTLPSKALRLVTQYYNKAAEPDHEWDSEFIFQVAILRMHGSAHMRRNHTQAEQMFHRVAEKLWPSDELNSITFGLSQSLRLLASHAAGFIGILQLRNTSTYVKQKTPLTWLQRGAAFNDLTSQYGLAYMYLHGLYGLKRNETFAKTLLHQTASQNHTQSLLLLGMLNQNEGKAEEAFRCVFRAAQNRDALAYKYLGDYYYSGFGTPVSHELAARSYKRFVEGMRISTSTLALALEDAEEYDWESSFMHYIYAAQLGYSLGETNVGYLLDDNKYLINTFMRSSFPPTSTREIETDKLALEFYFRAANQGDVDALVKVGDYYYYGIGVEKDLGKAYEFYQRAARTGMSSLAVWNLAGMHQYGIGRPQDIHLAKRLYDQLSRDPLSRLPLLLARFWLKVHWGYNRLLAWFRQVKQALPF